MRLIKLNWQSLQLPAPGLIMVINAKSLSDTNLKGFINKYGSYPPKADRLYSVALPAQYHRPPAGGLTALFAVGQ